MFYKADRRACAICGEPYFPDVESDDECCSVGCGEEVKRREHIDTARAQLKQVPTHDENHATIVRILGLLDALREDDHLDADSAHPEEESAEAKLAYVGATLDRLWRHTSTDLDPRFYAALKEMRERLGAK